MIISKSANPTQSIQIFIALHKAASYSIDHFRKFLEIRATQAMLSKMSERQLRDVGLIHNDLSNLGDVESYSNRAGRW